MTGPETCRPNPVPELQWWRVTKDNYLEVARWAGALHCVAADRTILLAQANGQHAMVRPGDYVLRGVTGKFFRCTAEEFTENYER